MDDSLFRGLSEEENATGNLILRRETQAHSLARPFPHLPIQHLRSISSGDFDQQRGRRTGISATRRYDVAVRYATRRGSKDGVVVRIAADKLHRYGFEVHPITGSGIDMKPEDYEVRIYAKGDFGTDLRLPQDMIEEWIPVDKHGKRISLNSSDTRE